MHDPETLAFYGSEACEYVARYRGEQSHDLAGFLDRLPPPGRVLELGCGGGGDTAAMLASGFDVVPTDGSPEMAREASSLLGRPVQVLRFEDLECEEAYDGVWASACLLHVPLADLSTVLARVHRALRPGGFFYASYKAGVGEGRDQFGRYYNYPSSEVLRAAYLAAGPWLSLEIDEQQGGGYDDQPTQWVSVTARRTLS
ncbi:SAM-dependent methyltransferase [Sphingomonas sp. Leaf208]|uniref:class I SAM-dependent methyltransferase n=1 Tax=Sphingomonas sp. Leaf208 TaxID=1735679 RepID=UPI0007019E7B|nr:class I SAM-dependent methyltransferase [Sphingomonas sp. Leaf208]KQM54501.1 SAM-dependent methyltransferase [Sphingomonas sp. Leaf208]